MLRPQDRRPVPPDDRSGFTATADCSQCGTARAEINAVLAASGLPADHRAID
jgi:hypothetical protein